MEDFYAAWIERLFDAPVEQSLDFRPLHQALRDRARNFLYGYLGLREDDPTNKAAIPATPDCADLPYFLRAYFAWKLALPVGFRDCDRGTDARPPKCSGLMTNEDGAPGRDVLPSVKTFLRQMSNHVQSGSARTALDDEDTDYYPVRLRPTITAARRRLRRSVRPRHDDREVGRADEGARRAAARRRRTARHVGRAQALLGGNVPLHERYEERGAGLQGVSSARARGIGVARAPSPTPRSGGADDPAHAPFSNEQGQLAPDAFYARMGKLINPAGLEPTAAYAETLDALVEQLQVRVGSVDNGETFMRANANPVVPMPRRREDLRDDGAVGGLRDAVARHAPHHRDQRAHGAPRPRRAPPRDLQPRWPQAGGRRRRAAQAARAANSRARHRVQAQRRLDVQAHGRRSDRPQDGDSRSRTTRTTASRRAGERRPDRQRPRRARVMRRPISRRAWRACVAGSTTPNARRADGAFRREP